MNEDRFIPCLWLFAFFLHLDSHGRINVVVILSTAAVKVMSIIL